jgi:hypothetical protein
MSLSKITFETDLVRAKTAFGLRGNRNTSQNLGNQDIEGSQPKVFIPKKVTRDNFVNFNADINGSISRPLHLHINRPVNSLVNQDIEGTKPNCVKFKTTREPSNPLNPVYRLQKVEVVPPEPPRFVRD